MKKTVGVLALVLILAAPFVWGLVYRGAYPTRQAASRDFVIEEDFTTVRKILVRKDAAKQIVTMGGGSEFVAQQWRELTVDAGHRAIGEGMLLDLLAGDPDWQLELVGDLQVRTLDEYIGSHVVALDQHVEITPDLVDSEVVLDEGTERLTAYQMATRFSRTPENQTRVELALEQEIVTDAPWFAHGIADRRVLASVERTLDNQAEAIRRVIEENKDDVGTLPLR